MTAEEMRTIVHMGVDLLIEAGLFLVETRSTPEGITIFDVKLRWLGMKWKIVSLS